MFKIFATICFLSFGAADQTLCFKSEVPLSYNTAKQCTLDRDKIIDYMHADLIKKEVTIIFRCAETNEINL